MAEIVCPHCHASVPRNGAFCPQCHSFIGRAADGEYEPAASVATSRGAGTGSSSRAARAAVAKDLFEEAVRSSMSASAAARERKAAEPDEDGGDPYPSDTELGDREPRRRRGPRPSRTSDGGRRPSALARAIVWLGGLPARTRALVRRLGPMPVTVAIVVLALLASGGLLYSVGAFRRHTAPERRPERHAVAAVRVLAPSKYSASCSAPASVDSAGHPVTFGAGHLVDGKTSTAWRCPGDGRKQRVTLTFAKPVQVT
ncbi:MAG: zinc ribbon domain-containing protein, partial [Acidothermales bacterium]|nr:zinc ribbon domain-containing protein [Acidothermales bacterium]